MGAVMGSVILWAVTAWSYDKEKTGLFLRCAFTLEEKAHQWDVTQKWNLVLILNLSLLEESTNDE